MESFFTLPPLLPPPPFPLGKGTKHEKQLFPSPSLYISLPAFYFTLCGQRKSERGDICIYIQGSFLLLCVGPRRPRIKANVLCMYGRNQKLFWKKITNAFHLSFYSKLSFLCRLDFFYSLSSSQGKLKVFSEKKVVWKNENKTEINVVLEKIIFFVSVASLFSIFSNKKSIKM